MARIGEILTSEGMINNAQLQEALDKQIQTGERLGKIIVDLNFISNIKLAQALALVFDVQFVNLQQVSVDSVAADLVSKEIAKKFKLIPFYLDNTVCRIAIEDPGDIFALDAVRSINNNISFFTADQDSILDAIEVNYEQKEYIEQEIEANIQAILSGEKVEGETSAPIIRLVELLFMKGIRDNASDLHITPEETSIRVSYRIDGIMRSAFFVPKQIQSSLINRIKILANIDIAEQRLPQGGGITFETTNRKIDMRCSTSPCSHGENIVIRILDKTNIVLGLKYLGLDDRDHNSLLSLTKRPHGILLCSGPTGSGKTTTLYSMLQEMNAIEKNILTIEDPIEYNIPLIKQTQVNEKAGLTFSTAIRNFLRQDPDIILVGEIRDLETAQLALQAAMTGHLVLSTVHANDSATTIPRLLNLGVESYLIPSTLQAVIAQRLIRKICPNCQEEYKPSEDELHNFDMLSADTGTLRLKRASGCTTCHNTGFHGQTGIFEILVISTRISELITNKSSSDFVRQEAITEGMRALRQAGLQKVLDGITTLEEVFRLT